MRYPDWPRRLNAYLVSVRDKEFEYGVFDCCIFTAGGVLTITGEDKMSEFRGKYNSKDSSQEALETIGAGDLYKTLTRILGKSLHGAMGQRGDVAFTEGCCGLVLGTKAIFLTDQGFGMIPITNVQRVFRIQ